MMFGRILLTKFKAFPRILRHSRSTILHGLFQQTTNHARIFSLCFPMFLYIHQRSDTEVPLYIHRLAFKHASKLNFILYTSFDRVVPALVDRRSRSLAGRIIVRSSVSGLLYIMYGSINAIACFEPHINRLTGSAVDT